MDNIAVSLFGSLAGGVLLTKIIPAAILVVACLVVIRILMKFTDKVLARSHHIPVTMQTMFRSVIRVLLYFVAVIIVMGFLGIPVTSLVAALSVVGVAVSLGVQNFLTNVVGGFQLLGSHPFEVGDLVEAGGYTGTVREIGFFYTRITTGDNKTIQIPNSSIVSASVTNYSTEETRRIDLTVSASYDADVELVKKTILEAVASVPTTFATPAPVARLTNYGASALDYDVKVWCATSDYFSTRYDVIEAIKSAFDAAGIEMTYDHLNVHILDRK